MSHPIPFGVRPTGFLPILLLLAAAFRAAALQPFQFPTDNRALLDADGGAERFYVGTAGKPWTSGRFGCVRSEGFQLHEGIDIRPLHRDRKGEPTDVAHCAADGTVAYVNKRPGLSNYGNYVVVRHQVDSLEVFTLYAHLASVAAGVRTGQPIRAGESVGVVGRTSNTRQRITPDRAHLHFEILFMANSRYAEWHRAHMQETRNDHGDFNGRNLLGIDPSEVFRVQQKIGSGYSLARHLVSIPELCRIRIRKARPDWVRRNPGAVKPNPVAEREGIAAWDLVLGFNGAPLQAIPRARSEIGSGTASPLLQVDSEVARNHPCGKLVVRRGQVWTLTAKGAQLVDILSF